MSFRDLRNFTEMMRALGYPRIISMQSFRTPNFPLVAEILMWLVKRYEPRTEIPTDISTEADRVLFIKAVAEFMENKAHVELNTKNVYKADGYAVKEMLKVTALLFGAMKTTETALGDRSDEDAGKLRVNTSQTSDLKAARQLASVITSKGASLCDLLAKEVDLKESRSVAMAKPFEMNEIEKALRAAIRDDLESLETTRDMLSKLVSDEPTLDGKIQKKKQELERNQKRFRTVQSVRPAIMDEYEKIEEELKEQYEAYVKKFRILCCLESQLEAYHRLEQERFEEAESKMRAMQQKLRQEERDLMWSSLKDEDSDMDVLEDRESDSDGEENRPFRPRSTKGFTRAGRDARVIGSMQGGDSDQSDDGEIDADEDDDEEEDDEVSKDLEDDSLDGPISRVPGFYTKSSTRPAILDDSDNDF
uniref:Clusterin associated protein 1 n=1 Tax=Tetraodon nigroviridis TaxID=99883 RepID=H3CXI0_TETNG